jgi:CheY-like chemotaxis protein
MHPLTILLAEDNPVNQRVAKLMLQRLGYRVDVVSNGLEALQAVERQAYDLLLTDVQMPEMDGYEATRRIRDTAALAGLRIIAMTANAMEEDRQRCADAGMDDFEAKPIDPDRMFLTLAKWLPPRPPEADRV